MERLSDMIRSFEFARKVEIQEDGTKITLNKQAYPEARLPEYATYHSAGADFYSAVDIVVPSIWKQVAKMLFTTMSYDIKVASKAEPIQPTFINTGIKANMYYDEVLELYNRSSNPSKLGLILANGVGVVDADYYNNENNDGDIMFAFYNIMPWDISIKVGDKLGQGVFKKFLRPFNGLVVREQTRTGGIGSTNKE